MWASTRSSDSASTGPVSPAAVSARPVHQAACWPAGTAYPRRRSVATARA